MRALAFAIVTPLAWIAAVFVSRRLPLPNDFGAALFVALTLGFAQAAVLAFTKLPRAWYWIAATAIGAIAGELVLSRVGFSHPILALPLGAFVTGLCHGVPQAFVLRSRTWPAIAPVAFFAGGVALVQMGTLRTVLVTFSTQEIAAFAATVGVIEALALAIVTRHMVE